MEKSKKILIINQGYSNKNLGDLAIRSNIRDLFVDLGFETHFAFFSNPCLKEPDFPEGNYFELSQPNGMVTKSRNRMFNNNLLFPYWLFSNRSTIIKKLKSEQFDIVAIGGGQLLHTSKSKKPHRFAIAMYWWTRMIRKYTEAEVFLIGVGVEGNFNRFERFLYKKSINRIDRIWVRDSYAKEMLYRHFKRVSILMPDVAFYKSKDNSRYRVETERRIAAIGIYCYNTFYSSYDRENTTRERYYQSWYNKLLEFERAGLEAKLFYTTRSDGLETFKFRDYILNTWNKRVAIASINKIDDLYNLYSSSSIVYSGRMHALILALKYGCRPEPFLLSQKLRSFNIEYILDERSSDELSSEIDESFSKVNE